ncbi:MAG: 4-hydroxybenzoate polyprenyltransferase [Candidatus Atelocyanobacterium thalassa isolate SIO64986]|uniref:4-hydroxybenzoate solanesyltransferase n=1 Tax=Candidatus Atelocyanobacterium thalassa isolate SIO64986 TaxID=1527444 RepID=A0A086CFV5_9CHRO|nr:MAG: 4-hydroxybenzoate polyprenyltransferase [Candidatus Atelocyanobacterium thalassa isolate SIO64986]
MSNPQFLLTTKSTWLAIIQLLRWNKPTGRLILMIPALWAVFLASRDFPPPSLILIIILGSLSTSSAGCVINDLWDRNIDPQVKRTKNRPLASRTLSIKVGIVTAFISLTCALVLSLYLNTLSFWLCILAVPFIVCYPLAKKFFPIPQLILSLSWGFAVLISWTAVTQKLEFHTFILWGITICWTLGFDTVYAMSDREDDRKIGINSSALFFGRYVESVITYIFALTALLWAYLAIIMKLNFCFWVAWTIASGMWFKQCILLRSPDVSQEVYEQIFKENVYLGLILLAGIITNNIY